VATVLAGVKRPPTAVALGLVAGFVLGMNSGAGAAAGAPRAQRRAASPLLRRSRSARSRHCAAGFLGQPLSDNAPIDRLNGTSVWDQAGLGVPGNDPTVSRSLIRGTKKSWSGVMLIVGCL
jgi:hypothetical protein